MRMTRAAHKLCLAYLGLLGVVLTGYALFGRTFAALGFRPLYIGEIALVLGVGVALLTLASRQTRRSILDTWHRADGTARLRLVLAPALLAAAMLWGALRTAPFIPIHGLDALRDAVVWGYGAFALIVFVLVGLLPVPESQWIRRYGQFARVFLLATPVLFLYFVANFDRLPPIPGDFRPLLFYKPSEQLVHLGGIAAFLALFVGGATPAGWVWMTLTAAEAFAFAAVTRGGLLAFMTALAIVGLVGPGRRWIAAQIGLLGLVVGLAALSGIRLDYCEHHREISARQFIAGVASLPDIEIAAGAWPRMPQSIEQLLGWSEHSCRADSDGQHDSLPSGSEVVDPSLERNEGFRTRIWASLLREVVARRAVLQGVGYGENLADLGDAPRRDVEQLRSPHNILITLLSASGVIGIVLWVLAVGAWFVSLLQAWRDARRASMMDWQPLFVLLAAYAAAFLMNALWAVYLEGPMGGIWFWAVIGAGMGFNWRFVGMRGRSGVSG